jgi:hypothetical protein
MDALQSYQPPAPPQQQQRQSEQQQQQTDALDSTLQQLGLAGRTVDERLTRDERGGVELAETLLCKYTSHSMLYTLGSLLYPFWCTGEAGKLTLSLQP